MCYLAFVRTAIILYMYSSGSWRRGPTPSDNGSLPWTPACLPCMQVAGSEPYIFKVQRVAVDQRTAGQSPPGTHGLGGFRGGTRRVALDARSPAWRPGCLPCTSHVLVSPRDAARREVYFLGVIGRRACVASLRGIPLVLAKLCSVEITVESGLHDPPPYTSHALVSPRDAARREVYFLGVLGPMCMCTKFEGNPSTIGRVVIS